MAGRHRDKVRATAFDALEGVKDGASVLVGGFGLCGNPEALIAAMVERAPKNLTLISNNAGNLGKGLAAWLKAGIVGKVMCSYLGNNDDLHKVMASGEVEVEVIPQGTLVERIRAGGAGIPGFYTPTGVGTVVAEGKEVREFEGRQYLLERAIRADYALVRGKVGDSFGNMRFWRTARNFTPIMATAAEMTIAELDHMVPLGDIDPDEVHLPGIFIHRVVEVPDHEDPFEYRTVRPRPHRRASSEGG
ncbi:MAG TPA: CoA transferase subunit A [Kofleriaceae bacterium]|nr:CoA transferase subunit A [Kofleriaceae bacterium]